MDFTADDFVEIRPEDVQATKPIVMVKNLPRIFDENDLHRYFRQYGKMRGLRLLRSKKGTSRGTVLVRYADCDIARICAETLQNHILDGQLLKTQLLDAKNDKDLKPVKAVERKVTVRQTYITEETLRRKKERNEKLRAELAKYNIPFTFPQ